MDLLLDELCAALTSGEGVEQTFDLVFEKLNFLRYTLPQDTWKELVSRCKGHRLTGLVQQDPMTNRCVAKPRGYPGDAVMLDYMYSGALPPGVTDVGERVFRFLTSTSNARSVSMRRDWTAHIIDRTGDARPGARVLSLACGHAREIGYSRAIREGKISELYAIDQDPESLQVVSNGALGCVRPVNSSVAEVLKGKLTYDGLDLVYSLGLYDYLGDRTAALLTKRLFDMLRPGGVLMVGNFSETNHGRGFMEIFMDWVLLCRSKRHMFSCAAMLEMAEVGQHKVYEDTPGNIVYLELVKTG